jgi:hypothetical protein
MMKIYFETNSSNGTSSHAEHVATLSFEPTTEAFWDAILLEASAQGFDSVTESIEDMGEDHKWFSCEEIGCNAEDDHMELIPLGLQTSKVTESIEDDLDASDWWRDGSQHTDSRYWDCECEQDYIWEKTVTLNCEKCGASHDEQPDSRAKEVQE